MIHNRMKEHRARLGLNQEELARRVGVRRETIGNLEKGRYNPFLQAGGPSHLGELQQQCLGSLYLTIGEVERTWQLLRVRHFAPILENILTLGLMAQADRLAEKGAEKND